MTDKPKAADLIEDAKQTLEEALESLGKGPPEPLSPERERVVQTTVSPDTLKRLNAVVVDEETSIRELLREGIARVLHDRETPKDPTVKPKIGSVR